MTCNSNIEYIYIFHTKMSEKPHLKVCELLPYFITLFLGTNIHSKHGKDFPPKSRIFYITTLIIAFWGFPLLI